MMEKARESNGYNGTTGTGWYVWQACMKRQRIIFILICFLAFDCLGGSFVISFMIF